MSIKHHPDESTLLAYAAGTLDEAFAVLVSCHLETCSGCRSRLKTAEQMGGAALECVEESPVDQGSFGRLLEKISVEEAKDQKISITTPMPRKVNWQEMPKALQEYLEGSLSNIEWKRVGPGIWQKPVGLSKGANSSLRLLKIANGKKVPEHGHSGLELTLILKGAYRDKIGHFGPGDVADLDEEIEHQPMVVSEEPCICLVATESPTKFKGIASRILQPFVGI